MPDAYDFTSPMTLPEKQVFVVRRGVAWMIVSRHFPAEWRETKSEAMTRAAELAQQRQWRVELVKSPGDDLNG